MKKIRVLSILLSLCLLLQTSAVPAFAQSIDGGAGDYAVEDFFTEPPEIPFGSVCVLQGCRSIEGMVPLGGSGVLLDTAQAAFLYETKTGTVVYSYNPDMTIAPGSLTKLVTGAIALQHCELDQSVKLTGEIHKLPSNARTSNFKTGEILTVEDLLYCLLLDGSNQAAIGLACFTAGNQAAFVALMNQWVASIGCTGTKFANVHGLDNADSVTTARDMVKIMMAAMRDENLVKIIGSMYYDLDATNKNEKRSFRTNNYMIDQGILRDFYDGRVKTGVASYVPSYGGALMVSAEAKGMEYIALVMGTERVFDEDDTVINYGNYNEMTKLIKYAFDNYKVNRIIYDGMTLGQFAVANGECQVVGQADIDVDSVVPINAHMGNLYMRFDVQDGLAAPIARDEMIATMQIEYRDSVLAEAEVYAASSVKVAGNNGVIIHSTASRTDETQSGFLSVVGTICVIGLGLAAVYLTFNAYMRSRIRARRRKRRAERRRNY